MTLPAPVKQAHIARALREAKKAGASHVRIGANGEIDIYWDDEAQPIIEPAIPQTPAPARYGSRRRDAYRDEKPPRIVINPKKKVRLS